MRASSPEPSPLTRPFWEAASREVLVRQRCGECGASFFPAKAACPRCLSEDWTWAESSGRGVVYSFTVVHRAPDPEFEVPYVLAVIDLDEGWSMLSNLVECESGAPRIAMPVEVTWARIGDELTLPVFRPAGAS